MLQIGKQFAQLGNFAFKTEHVVRAGLDFVPQIFHGRLAFGNLSLQHVELVPRELRFEMLQLL